MKSFTLNTYFNQINQPKFYQLSSKKKLNIDTIFDLHIDIASAFNISKDITKSHSLFTKGSSRKTFNNRFLTIDTQNKNSNVIARISQNTFIIFDKTVSEKYLFIEFNSFSSKIQFFNNYYINLPLIHMPSNLLIVKQKKSKFKKF
jgi:hypothetical protein